MLLTILPLASIFATIGPIISPISVLQIFKVLPIVLSAVWPSVNSLTMHQIALPVTFVLPTINPLICTKAINQVILPLTLILVAFSPTIRSKSIFSSLLIITYNAGLIRPNCLTLTMLNVIDPHSLVNCAVLASIGTLTVWFVSFEFSFELVPIRVPKAAYSMSSIFYPVSSVLRTVRPNLNAIPVSDTEHLVSFRLTLDRF